MNTPEFNFKAPWDAQREFFRAKLSIPTNHWDDIMKQAHDRGFMVAGAFKADLLNDLRQAVDKSITEGKSIEWFRKNFDQIVQAHGWDYKGERNWRTRVIYQTNMLSSYAAGRYQQLTDPEMLEAKPYWVYRHGHPVIPRQLHLDWNGMALPATDAWWQIHFPPNGWGCTCRVTAASKEEIDQHGWRLPENAPDDGVDTHILYTGQVIQMPSGVDYGWDYAPGATVAEQLRTKLEALRKTLPGRLKEDFMADMATLVNPLKPTNITSIDDFNQWMQKVADEKPEWLREGDGFQRAEVVQDATYLMGTTSRGHFWLNDRTYDWLDNFNAKQDLFSALNKVGKGGELTFNEEYAVESLWHEINHNRQAGVFSIRHLKQGAIQTTIMETTNQFVSRHTYADFLQAIGGEAKHVENVLAKGYGYRDWLERFNTMLDTLGIEPKAMVGRMSAINFENLDFNPIVVDVGEAIAKQFLGREDKITTAGRDVARVLGDIRNEKLFPDLLTKLAEKKWVQAKLKSKS